MPSTLKLLPIRVLNSDHHAMISHSRPILLYSHLICILCQPPHEIIRRLQPRTDGLTCPPSYTKSYRSGVMHYTGQTTNLTSL